MLSDDDWVQVVITMTTGVPPADPTTPLSVTNLIPVLCLLVVIVLPKVRQRWA